MPGDHREELRQIKSFPSLVKYLRDKLDWPIDTEDFDDLTFDYEPEELGLDTKTAAKIDGIKQLRPLVTGQPWGIFFVKFEPKRLPVVALRRILGQLVFKKRASASRAERPAWDPHDLLFISAFGEGDGRQISFAHFSEDPHLDNLATLRVLGWDGDDTGLHLDHVYNELHDKLHWPADPGDVSHWRRRWSLAFTLRYREVIVTSKDLAMELAELAGKIRKKVNSALRVESADGKLRKLMKAFQESLIHDLDEDDFADMYAQTIAYGLLSARVSRQSGALAADDVALMAPVTSPFLRELMETFLNLGGRKRKANGQALDFDELGVADVVEMLRAANMDAVLRDFGNRNPQEDPVIHFYELFLKEYDAKKRMQRGVFYTPKPVVSYIVRSVHELLQTEFGLPDGLADTTTWGEMAARLPSPTTRDAGGEGKLLPSPSGRGAGSEGESLPSPSERGAGGEGGFQIPEGVSPDEPFVQILDPALGTGTFLVEVIEVVHATMTAKWRAAGHKEKTIVELWNAYVPKHLLPRLYGFELMMAPYAIAHMKIGLKLAETGYRFQSDERARVYLTNSLEPAMPEMQQKQIAEMSVALAHEAQAVNGIKRYQRFTVVIGNPPYSYMTANPTPAAATLIEPFRFVDGERIRERSALSLERSLQDDFVKFFGFALSLRRATGATFILGMITNNSYMDSALHRGVRGELMRLLNRINVVNLFGDSIKDHEENVFDIQQGVAVFLGAALNDGADARVYTFDVHGGRAEKYATLVQRSWKTSDFIEIKPSPPQRYFLRLEKSGEYSSLPSLADIFPITSTCIKTLKDDLATDFDTQELQQKIEYFRNPNTSKEKLEERFGVKDVVQWKIEPARRAVRSVGLKDFITQYQARPFDYRWMFYHSAIVGSPRTEVMRNLLKTPNRALIANRKIRTGECHHVWVTSQICVSEVISSADNSNCFPLYILADERELKLGTELHPNLSAGFLKQLSSALRLPQAQNHGLPQGLTPEDIFHYAYAVFHSPGYRSRYAEFLKIDFPRLPLTGNLEMFRALARLGGELVALHLLESHKLDKPITEFIGGRNPEVEKVSWSKNTVWVDKAQTNGFKGVREDVWNFHIGGYQVCEKWLKDRKGRTLTKDDIAHYQKIVVALSETIRLMVEIDKVIDKHGGWPGAFTTEPVAETDGKPPPKAPFVKRPRLRPKARPKKSRTASRGK